MTSKFKIKAVNITTLLFLSLSTNPLFADPQNIEQDWQMFIDESGESDSRFSDTEQLDSLGKAENDDWLSKMEKDEKDAEEMLENLSAEPPTEDDYEYTEAPIKQKWEIYAGQNIMDVVSNWCDQEGYKLVWKANVMPEAAGDAVFEGSFLSSIDKLFSILKDNGSDFKIDIYKGNSVIVVKHLNRAKKKYILEG